MKPYIYIAGNALPTYALLALAGATAAILLAVCQSGRRGLRRDDTFYAALFGCIGGAVGGKLLYILTVLPGLIAHWGALASHPAATAYALATGGFVYYGGLFGAMLGVYGYARIYTVSAYGLMDVFAPALPLFHAFGRVGCLLAGCCYGIAYSGIGAVELAGQLRFPVQLLEAPINLLLSVLLLRLLRRHREGGVIAAYLMLYGMVRFFLEFLRGDAGRGFWLGLSTSQWLSFAAAGVGYYLWRTYQRDGQRMKTARYGN